jgi:hypothetical protein
VTRTANSRGDSAGSPSATRMRSSCSASGMRFRTDPVGRRSFEASGPAWLYRSYQR